MLRKGFKKFIASEDGVVLVLFAWTLPVLLGIAALAIDVSYSLASRNDAQRAADNAAMSTSRAALASSSFASEGDGLKFSIKEAFAVAEMNGYTTDTAKNTLVTVHSVAAPDAFELSTSRYRTIAGSIEVNISLPQSLFFGSLFQEFNSTVSPPQPITNMMKVRAVGQGTSACILVLNKRRDSDISVQSGNITTNCGFIVNSNFTTTGGLGAVTLSGSGTITVGSLTVRNPGKVWFGTGPNAGYDVCNPTATGKFFTCPYFTNNEAAVNPYAALNATYAALKPQISPYLPKDSTNTGTTLAAGTSPVTTRICKTDKSGSNERYYITTGSGSGCGTNVAGAANALPSGFTEIIVIDRAPSNSGQSALATDSITTSAGTFSLSNLTLQSGGITSINANTNLTIASGAKFTSKGELTVAANATLNVINNGQLYIEQGATINGTLNIGSGGTVIVDRSPGNSGAFTESLTVGGVINLNAGGRLIVRTGRIGMGSSSQIIVNGSVAAGPATKFIVLTSGTSATNPGRLAVSNGAIFRTLDLNQSSATPDEFLIEGGSSSSVYQVDNSGVIMFGSGLYYIDGGIIGGSSSFLTSTLPLTSANLPIITGASTASTTIAVATFGRFTFNSGTTIKLRSPKSGVWTNVAIYQTEPPASIDPYAGAPNNILGDNTANFPPWNPPVTSTITSNFQSAAAQMSIDGAVVLPWTDVNYQATNVDGTVCTFFIVNRFNFTGGSTLGSGCSSSSAISGVGQGFLVE